MKKINPAGLLLTGWLLSGGAAADWLLHEEYALVSVVSIKNNQIAELHRFESLDGTIDESGKAVINIALTSISTGIAIRDERMREYLFEVADFPRASITAQLDKEWLHGLEPGRADALDLELNVALHGQQQTITAMVGVIIDRKGNLHVETIQPVLLNASQFGLSEGIAKLQELAGLQAIATAVPVTFALVFKPR